MCAGDGFLRSWLPSYSNITRIVPSKGLGGEASKYCFLSVCQMQVCFGQGGKVSVA